jgi:putative FmdB family regulatory protein
MPHFEYECRKCGRKFSVTMSIGDHDKKKVQCPKCKSESVKQLIEPFFVTTSKKS